MITVPCPDIINTGLTTVDGKLTLNFDESIPIEQNENGLYLDPNAIGGGLEGAIDNWTLKKYSTDANNHTILGIKQQVVPCIYTLSRRKVTNRQSVAAYTTSNETKTMLDVIDEFNAAMDYYIGRGTSVPSGLPYTSYTFTVGDFFQFREGARPWVATNGTKSWGCAIDDANRYEDDRTKAFFSVLEAEYNNPNMHLYLTKLSLYCIWSELPEYVAGQTYTASKS